MRTKKKPKTKNQKTQNQTTQQQQKTPKQKTQKQKKTQTPLLQMLLVFKRYFEKVLPSFLRSFFNEAFLAFILDFVRRL